MNTNTAEKMFAIPANNVVAERVPERTLAALDRYFNERRPGSDFLRAVLSNNLKHACYCADSGNAAALVDIMDLLYNYAPAGAFGSPERYQGWIDGTLTLDE